VLSAGKTQQSNFLCRSVAADAEFRCAISGSPDWRTATNQQHLSQSFDKIAEAVASIRKLPRR
jgi:hypothetical protein